MNPFRTAVWFVLAFLTAGCLAAQPHGHAWGRQCDKTATPVLQESHSGILVEQVRIIDSEPDWCDFWDEAHSIMFPAPPCDTASIDFTSEVAVVATLGPRPTSGYGVAVSCVQDLGESGNIRVTATQVVPGRNCMTLPVVVHPVSVVKVDRPVKYVQIRKQIDVLDCPR